jgi:hypothetical protein
MIVVLCLDDGDGDIGLVIEDVIGAFRLATGDELAPNDDAPLGEGHLLADLRHPVPARALVQISRSLRSFLFMRSVAYQNRGVAISSLSAKSHDFIVYIR